MKWTEVATHINFVSLNFKYVTAMRQPIVAQQLDKGLFSPMARSLSNTKHDFTIVRGPTGQAPTEFVERFEVRPGDCGKESRWSDCENDRERSELKAIKDRISTKYWYGWSIYIPEDYVNVSPTSTALAQLHQLKAPGFTNEHPSRKLRKR